MLSACGGGGGSTTSVALSCNTDSECGGALESCQAGTCATTLTRLSNGGTWPDEACNPTNSFGGCTTNAQNHADAWATATCQNNRWDSGVWTGTKTAGCGNAVAGGAPSRSFYCLLGSIPCNQFHESTCQLTDQTIIEFTCSGAGSRAPVAELGSIASSRFLTSWTLDGASMTQTVAKLQEPANFGLTGTVKSSINITSTAATLNAGVLSAFDVFFIGWLPDVHANAFTAAELNALTAWVTAGGVLIATCDDSAHDAVCASFGHPVIGNPTIPMIPSVAGASHTLFSGAFGSPASVLLGGAMGVFGLAVDDTVLGVDSSVAPGLPMVVEDQLGSGRVIVLSDVNMIRDGLSLGTGISTDNDKFLGNLFEYATGMI